MSRKSSISLRASIVWAELESSTYVCVCDTLDLHLPAFLVFLTIPQSKFNLDGGEQPISWQSVESVSKQTIRVVVVIVVV